MALAVFIMERRGRLVALDQAGPTNFTGADLDQEKLVLCGTPAEIPVVDGWYLVGLDKVVLAQFVSCGAVVDPILLTQQTYNT